MKPEFEKAAELLAANDPPVALAKVDCTEAGKDTCGRFDVRGYPTLKIFRSGEMSMEYQGPREVHGIVKYMKAQVGPSSFELKNAKDVEKLLTKSDVVIITYDEDNKEFQKVADAMREKAVFGHYVGSDAKEKGIWLHRPTHLHSKLEDGKVKYDGDVSKDALNKWITKNFHGLVGHRTTDNAKDFGSPIVISYYDVDYVKNVKGTNYWRNRIMKVAADHRDIIFAVSNYNDFMQEAQEFGLSAVVPEKPRVVIKKGANKYVMEDDFSIENLEKFIKNYEAGKLEAYLKSEPVPSSNDGPVKVAVAKNFAELVTDSEKDVLVSFRNFLSVAFVSLAFD
jgi:protein disulfide isomerase family A protein 3